MILFCEECGTRLNVDPSRIREGDCRVECHVCHEVLMVTGGRKPGGKTAQANLIAGGNPPRAAGKPLSILVVDDSKMIRRVLREIIESDSRKKVVGEAEDGRKALALLVDLKPDVVTLDINMPVMDGLTTLKHIMIQHPVPTVMISALTQEGATETFESLKYGAIDFLPKPSRARGGDLQAQRLEIIRKVEMAAAVQMESVRYLRRPSQEKAVASNPPSPCRSLVVMGVAEGGYGALLNVIPRLNPRLAAAYVAVMHQPAQHLDGFARYLDHCSRLTIQRAGDGVPIHAGRCYLAAAGEPLTFVREAAQMRFKRYRETDCRPDGAIDRIMGDVAHLMGTNATGVILTGAGDDGLAGLGAVIGGGGTVFIQDPGSCLFKETPMKAADQYDMANLVSDKRMAGAINAHLTALGNEG